MVGKVVLRYEFIWNDVTYQGTYFPSYDLKQVLFIGDTTNVVFLEDSPEINKSNALIKTECK